MLDGTLDCDGDVLDGTILAMRRCVRLDQSGSDGEELEVTPGFDWYGLHRTILTDGGVLKGNLGL